jgi:hypothetical protein
LETIVPGSAKERLHYFVDEPFLVVYSKAIAFWEPGYDMLLAFVLNAFEKQVHLPGELQITVFCWKAVIIARHLTWHIQQSSSVLCANLLFYLDTTS